MTTATVAYNETTFAQTGWRTDITSQQEEFFNCYGAALYERTKEFEVEDVIKFFQSHISQKNLEAIKFLDQWMAEPDDLGEEFWKEFCDDLEKNRFTI